MDGPLPESGFELLALTLIPSESTGGGKGARLSRERRSLISRCCVSTCACSSAILASFSFLAFSSWLT